jgi:hypothetical protein
VDQQHTSAIISIKPFRGSDANACMDADLSAEALAKAEAFDIGAPLGNIATG